MKDLIENRGRVSWAARGRLGVRVLQQNGPAWTSALVLYLVSSRLAESAHGLMTWLRRKNGLPGMNSLDVNRELWDAWNWEKGGEEWTLPGDWKESLLRRVMDRWIARGGHVLEIGPGAGRWTGHLLERCERLSAVDISQQCIDICSRRFASSANARFLLGNGGDLRGIDSGSIDAVWSFDVFVHINEADVDGYLAELGRVMRSGAVAVIHHGTVSGEAGGWRSNLDLTGMQRLIAAHGFATCETILEWSDDGRVFQPGYYKDAISVFRSEG